MDDSAKYRANAMACAEFAEQIADPRRKVVLLTMAEAWLRLADHVELRCARQRTTLGEAAAPIDPRAKPPQG